MNDNKHTDRVSNAQERAYPTELRTPETARLDARRETLGIAVAAPTIGFALSGGGIRSATFCLGIFQALAKAKQIRRIDFLSTVSGGGYFGAFLGRLITRGIDPADGIDGALHPDTPSVRLSPDKPGTAGGHIIKPVVWLLRNGNYMAPGGGSDVLGLLTNALRNLLTPHVLVAANVLLLALLLRAVEHGLAVWSFSSTWLGRLPSVGPLLSKATGGLLAASPVFDVLPVLAVLLLPPAAGYWLIERHHRESRNPATQAGWLVLASAYVMLLLWLASFDGWSPGSGVMLAFAVVGAVALSGLLAMRHVTSRQDGLDWRERPSAESLHATGEARNRLGNLFGTAVLAIVGVAMLGAIDGMGLAIYQTTLDAPNRGWWGGLITLFAPLALRFTSFNVLIGKVLGSATHRYELPVGTLVALFGFAAWVTVGVLLCALSQGIAHGFSGAKGPASIDAAVLYLSIVLLLLVTTLFARTWAFINRSSHATVYAARLVRTFLGASNPKRHGSPHQADGAGATSTARSINDPLQDDDSNMRDYYRTLSEHGGPLHLINVTINKTASLTRKSVDRDRKGIGMAVGPCGLSAGIRHHAILKDQDVQGDAEWHVPIEPVPLPPPDRTSMFAHDPNVLPASQNAPVEVERLTLGQWMAISGAAVSTGLGSRTTLGLSLALSFANLRLGYWWDSGRRVNIPWSHRLRLLFPVQAHLLDEILGRFVGPEERHWYLSDGGHFENTGGYELIRRRLDLIVVIDAEEDPTYACSGFAGLVRKARLDFGAEITVLARDDIRCAFPSLPDVFGSLDELSPPAGKAHSARRAVLAKLTYADELPASPHWLLYVKPTLDGTEPADLREYRALHPTFPQQPTADQMFDEGQWESYRKLGECVGDAVFAGSRTVDILLGEPRTRPSTAGTRDTSNSPDCPVGFP